ncbi:hypothetical protein [Novosphingobium sp. KA1]|uniref:hypothetical protein n=1 Tax=Novosphingobium sp. (strain KA1) TaxID=164608 RepID=UPI001A8F9619|nr:hypothetical protein [Novosphingobium sp. KA1]QSR17444.1 hypothetical protein CA833_09655 [Novosphingobium sp. KA1]
MKYVLEAVFSLGFLVLGGMAIFLLMRFIIMVWVVRVAERVILGTLNLIKSILFALIFVFAPAILGAFIIALGLQIALNASSPTGSGDPTMPVLIGLLSFFAILAMRIWQWQARRQRETTLAQAMPDMVATSHEGEASNAQDPMALAWYRAMKIAPKRQDELMSARAACVALLTAVDQSDGLPDTDMIETATLIRNHLIPFVDSMERRLQGATRAERKGIVDEMARYLLGFGDRARRALAAAGPDQKEQDAALHAHLSAQLFR